MESAEDAVRFVVNLLNDLEIPYVLTGSLASNQYGIARSTKDADFVLSADSAAKSVFFERFPPEFEADPQQSFEIVTGATRQVFAVRPLGFKIEFFDVADDDFARSFFERRQKVTVEGLDTYLPMPEDVLLQKMRWYKQLGDVRLQDRADCRDVMAVQGAESLDWEYLRKWGGRHGTLGLLEEIRESVAGI